jgi:hypothetical protein
MDTNPYANNNQTAATNQNQPNNLNNGTTTGGIAAMVKAIMDGNDAYKQKQAQMGQAQMAQQPGAPTSLSPPQDPLNPAGTGTSQPIGLTNPVGQSGGLSQPIGASSVFTGGTSPVSIDPVSQALMSPIPGM